jgi:hypothetical protein
LIRRVVDVAERRARLGVRHHLATPVVTPESAAGDVIGLHSSDPATVFLSARPRVASFDVPMLERSLYERRSLVRIHGMRRTMFVAPVDLAGVIDASCTRRVAATERKRLFGVLTGHVAGDVNDWFDRTGDAIVSALRTRGEALATDIKADVPEAGLVVDLPTGPYAVISRLLFQLAVEGKVMRTRPRGSWRSSQYHWTATDTWLPGGFPRISEDDAQLELVSRWLRTYGPATLVDVAWWTGWPKGRTAAVLAQIGAVEVTLTEGIGYVHPEDVGPVATTDPWVSLLPGLDPATMGWKQRDWYLGPHRAELFDVNGNAGPTVWVDGRVVGGWAQRPSGEVVVQLLEDVGTEASGRVESEAEELSRWLDGHVVIPRFRVPLERRLSGATTESPTSRETE